jgi:hypothetical protein
MVTEFPKVKFKFAREAAAVAYWSSPTTTSLAFESSILYRDQHLATRNPSHADWEKRLKTRLA